MEKKTNRFQNTVVLNALSKNLLTALQNSRDIAVLSDADAVILYANQRILNLSGFDESKLVGHPLTKLWIQPNDRSRKILKHLRQNNPWQGQILHRSESKMHFDVNCTISPLSDHEGRVTHLFVTGQILKEDTDFKKSGSTTDTSYRSILNLMSEGYLETDLKGNITFINKSAAKIYQRSPRELIGLNYRAYMSSDQTNKIFQIFNNIYLTRKPGPLIEYEILGKDGAPISCETMTALLCDNKGTPLGFGGVIRDVSRKKELARKLKDSEESYRRVMELAPDAITITRVSDGKYFEVNETFCKQTGHNRADVIGRTVDELQLYADPEDRERLVSELRKKGYVEGIRVNFRHKDGTILYDIVSARVIQFKGEECLLLVATLINSLVETQKALEESENRYRLILSAAPDAICLTRMKDGRYIEANNIFYERTGYKPEEVIGKTTADINIYADKRDRKKFISTLNENGHVNNMEIMVQYKDGTLSPQIWSGRRLKWNSQECILVVAKPIDDLKQTQKELEERENSYRTILNSAPYAIVIQRRSDGTYALVNDAFCSRSGYSREEVIGRTPEDLGFFANPDQQRQMRELLRRDKKVLGFELEHRNKNGDIQDLLISISPITHMGERCFLIITINISTQKKAQKELEKSKESYRTMIESAPYSIDVLSKPELKYVMVNDTFCKDTGYSREDVIGKHAIEIGLLQNPEQIREMRQRIKRDGMINGMELDIITKNGAVLNALCHLVPIRHMGEDCYLDANIDLTPLKKAQSALRESEVRFRAIFETAADAIWVVDPETETLLNVNKTACRHLGYTQEALQGMKLSEITTSRHPYLNPISKGARDRFDPVFFESLHIAKDGRRIPVEVSSGMVMHSGRPVILSIIRDVSQRKQTEAELAQYRKHLEEMVQERTEELKQAQKELVKKEKLSVLGQLTATVSHELRNPLGVIRSSNFYLKRRIPDPDEKVNKHLGRIEEQVSLCDTIVSDLLEYTRGRQVSISRQTIQQWIDPVVEQIVESSRFPILKTIAGNLPPIPHDPEKMRRVVINLLNNAIQAVETRQESEIKNKQTYVPMISIKLYQENNCVCLTVEDNGSGMDKKTQKHAFEPLFTTRARGTGIGLAIVNKITDEHNGWITLKSKQGTGTVITIKLPMEQADGN